MRRAGYPVLAYSINDPERARQLYGWGVTSVISYAPDAILAGAAHDAAVLAASGAGSAA
jgi:glycerophosphoryl diester phosphodiesterase